MQLITKEKIDIQLITNQMHFNNPTHININKNFYILHISSNIQYIKLVVWIYYILKYIVNLDIL